MSKGASASQTGLRVWWVPQMPCEAFEVDVPDLATADLLLDVLANYDAFQFEHGVKPDYCNAGGLMMFENGEWVDWYDDALNCEFDEWREANGRRAASAMSAGTAETNEDSAQGRSPASAVRDSGDAPTTVSNPQDISKDREGI
jgi:hypothetical protein